MKSNSSWIKVECTDYWCWLLAAPNKLCVYFVLSQLLLLLYTGKYLSPFYFRPFHPGCQLANIRLGESQCLKLFFFKQNCVWGKSRPGETGCKCRWAKILPGAKITLYTVLKNLKLVWKYVHVFVYQSTVFLTNVHTLIIII